MLTRLLRGGVCLATLAALGYATPEIQAQRRGRDPVALRTGDAHLFYGPTRTYSYPSDTITAPPTARIQVRLDDPDAEIWINESATRQRGAERWFETPPLAGHGGTYEIRAIWTNKDGETMDQIQEIEVGPGVEMFVDFTEEREPDETR